MSLEERDKAETEQRDTNDDEEVPGDTDSNEEVQEDNANGRPPNGDTDGPQGNENMVDTPPPPPEERPGDEPGDARESGDQEGEPQPAEDGQGGELDGQEETDAAGETENGLPEGLKIVLQLSQGRATLGVWKPDADPHLETVGWETLEDVLEAVPNAVQQALESWEESPMRPKYIKPKPPRKNQRSGRNPKAEPQPATRQPELQPEQPQTGMARLF